MDARITGFVGLLRQNGLRVSPAEVADAARATLLIGVGERDPFRSALRATLVKRGPDAPVFDRLFDLYFLGVKDLVDGLSGALLDALAAEKLNELELEEAARVLAPVERNAQGAGRGRAPRGGPRAEGARSRAERGVGPLAAQSGIALTGRGGADARGRAPAGGAAQVAPDAQAEGPPARGALRAS